MSEPWKLSEAETALRGYVTHVLNDSKTDPLRYARTVLFRDPDEPTLAKDAEALKRLQAAAPKSAEAALLLGELKLLNFDEEREDPLAEAISYFHDADTKKLPEGILASSLADYFADRLGGGMQVFCMLSLTENLKKCQEVGLTSFLSYLMGRYVWGSASLLPATADKLKRASDYGFFPASLVLPVFGEGDPNPKQVLSDSWDLVKRGKPWAAKGGYIAAKELKNPSDEIALRLIMALDHDDGELHHYFDDHPMECCLGRCACNGPEVSEPRRLFFQGLQALTGFNANRLPASAYLLLDELRLAPDTEDLIPLLYLALGEALARDHREETAAIAFRYAAAFGSSFAFYKLYELYDKGIDEASRKRAKRYLKLAALKGEPEAIRVIANTRTVTYAFADEFQILLLAYAMELGSAKAALDLARVFHEPNEERPFILAHKKKILCFDRAVTLGEPKAMARAFDLYSVGSVDHPKDLAKAYQLAERLYYQGAVRFAGELVRMLNEGMGCPKNQERAKAIVEWISPYLNQGDDELYASGLILHEGFGPYQDPNEGQLSFLEIGDDPAAMTALGQYYAKDAPEQLRFLKYGNTPNNLRGIKAYAEALRAHGEEKEAARLERDIAYCEYSDLLGETK